MTFTIGIRREDKNEWERRAPLTPEHVKQLKKKNNINTIIQPSSIRIFPDITYEMNGGKINENLSDASVVFAVKEIPYTLFEKNKTYVFFSHTIKGQQSNMPMLRKMMDLSCSLIDYERIVDSKGRRLVFFGKYAGLAGMIDTLWGYGQRLKHLGIETPLSDIKQTVQYSSLDDAKKHLTMIGKQIQNTRLPEQISPLIIGFAGYGNVSLGAQEILDLFPLRDIAPEELKNTNVKDANNYLIKVVFKEEHIAKPKQRDAQFNLQEYYDHPDRYAPNFEQFLPNLTILMNCIYWDERYPRLVTKQWLKSQNRNDFRLQAIGDISVDIDGAIEFTEKVTTPARPCFIYDYQKDIIKDGVDGDGIVVMAIDNLPCELPKESSLAFSNALIDLVPLIVKTDFSHPLGELNLPIELQHALILHRGKLTSEYRYIDKYL
jgi:alpha-aminoadipic semialdehyde synthase